MSTEKCEHNHEGFCADCYTARGGTIYKGGALDENGVSAYPRELFPRVTFRDLEDAQMVGTVTYEYAMTLLEECQKIREFQRINALDMGLEITMADRNGEHRSPNEALAIYSERLMKCAQLLGAVSVEIERLQRGSDAELSAEDKAISDQFAAIVKDLQSQAEGES